MSEEIQAQKDKTDSTTHPACLPHVHNIIFAILLY